MGKGWEPPDVAVPHIDNDFAQNLPAAIGGTQHGDARLNLEHVAFVRFCHRYGRGYVGMQSDCSKRNCNQYKKTLCTLVGLHITLLTMFSPDATLCDLNNNSGRSLRRPDGC